MTQLGRKRKLGITCEESALSAEARPMRPGRGAFLLDMDRYDALAAIGIGLVGVGCWLIYAPLGFIAMGAMLIGAALVGARANGRGGR